MNGVVYICFTLLMKTKTVSFSLRKSRKNVCVSAGYHTEIKSSTVSMLSEKHREQFHKSKRHVQIISVTLVCHHCDVGMPMPLCDVIKKSITTHKQPQHWQPENSCHSYLSRWQWEVQRQQATSDRGTVPTSQPILFP